MHRPNAMAGSTLPRDSRRQASGRRGVTFVELITLTIALLILASIGIPRISPVVQNFRLKGAAWQLAGDLRLARQRAVTLQQRFRICLSNCKITVPEGTYSLEMETLPVGSLKWRSETGAAVKLPQDVSISAKIPYTATFAANGLASGNTFTLTNLMGSYQVVVNSTGQVKVCQGTCSP